MAISARPDIVDDSAPSPWAGQRMTLDEFLALPEQVPALEYIDGVVRQKVSAKPVHGSILQFLSVAIELYARPRRLGVVLPDTRFVMREWSPVPDLMFYRRERLRVRRAPDDFKDPPDLAIEIQSPGQSLSRQLQKCLDLVNDGTLVAVLVYPPDRSVFLFRKDRPLLVYQDDERLDLDDVLPGFDLRPRELFESENWAWLDDEPEVEVATTYGNRMEEPLGQAEDDAAAPERSDG